MSALIPSREGKNQRHKSIIPAEIMKFINALFSRPREFNSADEMFVKPSGKSTQEAD